MIEHNTQGHIHCLKRTAEYRSPRQIDKAEMQLQKIIKVQEIENYQILKELQTRLEKDDVTGRDKDTNWEMDITSQETRKHTQRRQQRKTDTGKSEHETLEALRQKKCCLRSLKQWIWISQA